MYTVRVTIGYSLVTPQESSQLWDVVVTLLYNIVIVYNNTSKYIINSCCIMLCKVIIMSPS